MTHQASWFFLVAVLATCELVNAQTAKICPPQELILPCRCLIRGDETQIWCSHSDLPRVIGGLKAVGQHVFYPIDELILENNNLPSLPGRTFLPLQVMRLMLRYNGLERVSNGWLNGLETSLMELYIVEPELRSLPEESLERMETLEAVTIQSSLMKHLPNFSALPKLRYIQIESFSLSELSPRHYKNLPVLEKFQLSGSMRLHRLELGLLQDLPNLQLVNISYCGINSIHPRAIARLPSLTDLSLIGNSIVDAGMIGRGVRDLPRLENLNLDYNEIDKLGEADFVDLPSLKRLTLSNNQITELNRGAFHRVPKLKLLDLNNNLVRRVHPESFLLHSSTGLEELWISHNEISHVVELRAILDALPRLVFLEMSNNNLEAIPFGSLRGHPTLERLHLDHNNIHLIDRDAFMAMPALRELRLKNNSLSDVLEGPLWNLPALKGLDLSHNYFRRIEPRIFENIPSLRRIDLHGNDLEMIDPATFLVTPSLEHVNLSMNSLTTIHPATFRHLHNLFEVDLSYNRLIEFVPGLPRGVEYLHLSHNQINVFPMSPSPDLDLPSLRLLDISANLLPKIPGGSLKTFPQLRKLNLGGNVIQELDDRMFGGLKHLDTLNLEFNRVMHIHPGVFKDVGKLQNLNLRENRIDVLRPEVFERITNLKKLDVSRNQLAEILPGTLESFREIEEFYASDNLLIELPQSLYGMKKLRLLDLSNNRLQLMNSETLSSLASLKELKMSKNNIRSLKTGSFHKLIELETLHLDDNQIENVESFAFHSLPLLKEMRLDSNKMQVIGNSVFSDLPSLEVLELQNNQIQKMAKLAFEAVPHLLMLNLSNNFISNLDEVGLQGVSSLEMLDLSFNKLTRVSANNFEKMEWLVELRMDSNNICMVHGSTFNGMPRLRVLSVRNNRMMTFPELAIEKLRGNLAVFDLEGNPLMCSCSMLWMRSWLLEASLIGPRCVDGTLLREMRYTREDCLHEENRIEHVAPGCEAELLSVPTDSRTTYGLDHWMSLRKQNITKQQIVDAKNNLAPSPEESDYFYDEYVDYPVNMTSLAENGKNTVRKPSNNQNRNHQSSHYIPGDTPTIYAASNKNKSKLQPPKEVTNSPSSSGFTFFGVPLPSLGLNNLFGNNGRMSEKRPTVPSILLQTPIAQRKAAIVNKPTKNNFKNTIKMPPSIPEVQTGGFVPILPGEGGFLPMVNHTKPNANAFSVDINKVNVKPDSSNLSPTRLEVSTHSYILEDERYQNMGHPIPLPTEPTNKNQERRSTTARPSEKYQIERVVKNKTVINETKTVNSNGYGSTFNKLEENNVKIVQITPSTPRTTTSITTSTVRTTSTTTTNKPRVVSSTTTKKPKKSQNYGDLEIASDAQSFDEIFKDIVENVSVPEAIISTSTMVPITSSTTSTTIATTVPSYTNKNNEELIGTHVKAVPNVKKEVPTIKKEVPTPLATLLAPGGMPNNHKNNVKSSITKVQSPHMQTSSVTSDLSDLTMTDDIIMSDEPNTDIDLSISPMAHNREAKNAYTDLRKQDEATEKNKENNWYFMNYNKTNLEPFIGPGSEKFNNGTNNGRVTCEFLLFLCIFIANII